MNAVDMLEEMHVDSVSGLRVVLADPVCVSERGHNLPLLLDYRAVLSDLLGSPVEAHVCDLLPADVRERHDLQGTLPFPYGHVTQLLKNLNLKLPEARATQRTLSDAFTELLGNSSVRTLIVFPYADYEGVLACRDAVVAMETAQDTAVALRFIGVMETSAPQGVDALSRLGTAVHDMRRAGCTVTLSAESSPLAASLSSALREVVDLVPPIAPAWARGAGSEDSGEAAEPFVYCPGSGRDDKGFTLLPDIVTQYRRRYPDSALGFVCQDAAPSLDMHLHSAHIRLQAVPGVQVLPSLISTEKMAELYATASFVLLPYSQGTYEYRSSASLADAFAACAPVVTFTGTGLESYVTHYGVGKTARNTDELIDACHDLYLEGRATWRSRTTAGRWRYDRDTTAAWLRWLGMGEAS